MVSAPPSAIYGIVNGRWIKHIAYYNWPVCRRFACIYRNVCCCMFGTFKCTSFFSCNYSPCSLSLTLKHLLYNFIYAWQIMSYPIKHFAYVSIFSNWNEMRLTFEITCWMKFRIRWAISPIVDACTAFMSLNNGCFTMKAAIKIYL